MAIPINVWLIRRFRGRLWGLSWSELNERAEVAAAIDEPVRGIRVVRAFGREDVEAQLRTVLVQDWQKDPCARGAYSYVLVNGEGARQSLAAPLRGTLYFAGEATSTEQSGTVAGALESGTRAARELLQRESR